MNGKKGLNARELMDDLRSAIRHLHLSRLEVVFLLIALAYAAVVSFAYLTRIQPRQSELRSLRQREQEALKKLSEQKKQDEQLKTQRENLEKILDSLKDFEGRLKDQPQGMTKIIDEVNQLARANRVAITGGINFQARAPEATEGTGNNSSPAARNTKKGDVYPVLGIETTVEGDYHDLRRFISDLERSQQFVIINALALQSVDPKSRGLIKAALPGQPQPAGPASSGAVTISLKIEMDTFFQKPAAP
jgi:Tfp pilus assembly protein PilO